ncbi:hypothetical protein NPIL_75241 [Nephila pilipes]|uniref:Uncharacterized protein n=1 Tax=Nephila pilipes TaxID=299642 RepID=A0A8X6MC79_NEPPI|nr:hypothetical protein NPIL_75241 [Nephila pilipes]
MRYTLRRDKAFIKYHIIKGSKQNPDIEVLHFPRTCVRVSEDMNEKFKILNTQKNNSLLRAKNTEFMQTVVPVKSEPYFPFYPIDVNADKGKVKAVNTSDWLDF